MEPEYSFPHSQKVTTIPNPEPFQSSSHVIPSRSLLILQSHPWLGPENALLLTAFPTKVNCVTPSRHVELLLYDNSNSNFRRYRLRNPPRYTVFSLRLLLSLVKPQYFHQQSRK